MKAGAPSVDKIRSLHGMLAAMLLTLVACSNGAGTGHPGPDASAVSIAGNVTLKGAEPGAWWAVTDDQGQVWRIKAPTPEQLATLQQAQNRRVRVDGHREEKYLNFDQIRLLRIVVEP